MREFRSPDGRRWRVWAVHPGEVGRAVRIGVVGERRHEERRRTPVEALADPPVLQRRRHAERRIAAATARRAPAEVLPAPWCEGWLVFQADPEGPTRAGETRRLAPLPACWDGCSDAELVRHLDEARMQSAAAPSRTAPRAS